VRIQCEGVGENAVFSGDYKGQYAEVLGGGDDIDSDQVGSEKHSW